MTEEPNTNTEEINRAEQRQARTKGFELASALISHDLSKGTLPVLFCFIFLPLALQKAIGQPGALSSLLYSVAELFIVLTLLGIVSWRWIRTLSQSDAEQQRLQISALALVVVAGFSLTLLVYLPLMLSFTPGMPFALAIVSLLLLFPAIRIYLKHFFYFVPFLNRNYTTQQAISVAREFVAKDPLLAVATMISPLAIKIIIWQLSLIPYPDERSLVLAIAGSTGNALFYLLSIYLSVGFALEYMPGDLWRSFELDPYREPRLETLRLNSRSWLTRTLSSEFGWKLLFFIALPLFIANLIQFTELEPAPSIRIEQIEIEGENVRLYLDLHDEEFSFRGFRPIHFRLAGETGTTIAPWPTRATAGSSANDALIIFPTGRTRQQLVVQFLTDRKSGSLAKLKDLYLWYNNVRLQYLDMPSAKVIEESEGEEKLESEEKKEKLERETEAAEM